MDRQRQRQALEAKRKSLEAAHREIREHALGMSIRDATGVLSVIDNHPADLASTTFQREMELGFEGTVEDLLGKVEAALGRLDEGSYGMCTRCGRQIAEERLEAQPWSELCIDCQRSGEVPASHPRPIEEDVLAPPFGRSFKDASPEGVVGFDGEDSWQAVARMGTSNTPSDVPPAVNYGDTYVGFESENIGFVEDTDIAVEGSDPGDLPQAPGIAPPEAAD